jgi:hypothetical protein
MKGRPGETHIGRDTIRHEGYPRPARDAVLGTGTMYDKLFDRSRFSYKTGPETLAHGNPEKIP